MTNAPHSAEISRVLDDLRSRIRRYVVWEGLAIVVLFLGAMFWGLYLADELHFAVRKLELPLWLRRLLAVAGIAGFTWLLLTRVVVRLLRPLEPRSLALLLERRFPDLAERLITAVELEGQPLDRSAVSNAMLQQTLTDLGRQMGTLDVTPVFDFRPLKRGLLIAGVVLASIIGFGVVNAQAMSRWVAAYIGGETNYWERFRRNALHMRVVAQPGDKIRHFNAQQIYKHPRGGDLVLQIESDKPDTAPDNVALSWRSLTEAGRTRGTVNLIPATAGVYRHTMKNVVDEQLLWLRGGDFANGTPYQVVIVEPPRIDRVELQCDYPAYMGMDSLEDRPVVPTGTQVTIPAETRFELQLTSNKPLLAVDLRAGTWDLSLGYERATDGTLKPQPARLTLRETPSSDPRTVVLEPRITAECLPGDRTRIVIPSWVTAKAAELNQKLDSQSAFPLPLTTQTELQIHLFDEDEVDSQEPATLSLIGTPDEPPVVDVKRRGVRNAITRTASVPLSGTIQDDYGLAQAEFEYRVDALDLKTAPFQNPPRGQREYQLAATPQEAAERFSVLPLELKEGQKLTLSVVAVDGDDQTGPHRVHSETFDFLIVSPEELLGRLYDQEVNLRSRLEQILEETSRVQKDLNDQHKRAGERITLKSAEPTAAADKGEWEAQLRQLSVAISAGAERNLHLIRKNHAECKSIEAAFRDIREEMVNNRVDSQTLLDRIDGGIVAPLKSINDTTYTEVDQRIGLYRLREEQSQDPRDVINDSLASVDRLVEQLKKVLSEMRERESINDLKKRLQEMIDRYEKLNEATELKKFEELTQ